MKKLKISLLLIAIMIMSMSVAFAADENVSDDLAIPQEDFDALEIDSEVDDVSQASVDVEVLAAGTSKNFTVLQNEINTATGPVFLNSDYERAAGESDISISKDLTVIGSNNPKIDAKNLGGIFNVQSGHSLTLMGVTLINGNSEYGGAIYNDGGSVNIVNSKLIDNTATKSGGAIYNNAGTLLVSGSTLDGNDLTDRSVNGYGGAAIYGNGGTVIITGSEITNNLKNIVHRGGTGAYTGDLSSAAVTTKHGTLSVSDSYFARNSGSYGGAILAQGTDATLTVERTRFEDNFAFNGGAIDVADDAKYTIDNCTFKGNDAKGTGSSTSNYATGGAICAAESRDDCIISNCTFEDNTAAIGGAISCTKTAVVNCSFTNNNANSANSEKYNGKTNNKGGFGGAIYNDNTITIEDSNFTDNIGRGRGLDLKNAEISGSSFDNTIISVNNKGTLSVEDNTYNNAGNDISASGCTVNIGEGQIPKTSATNGGRINFAATGFTDLQAMIDSGSSGTVYLTGDVTKLDSEYETFANGISVDRSVSINGDGHTITSDNGKVFNVASTGSLGLSNAEVVGDGTSAIVNDGTVSLGLANPATFTNVGDYAIENNGRVSQSGLTTFTQLDNLIGLVNGGEVYIGSSKITKADDEKATYADGITIDKDLTITGYYSSYYKRIDTELNADNDGRIFNVDNGAALTLNSIVLKNGNAEKGGAVYVNEDATLNTNNVEFIDNTAVYRGGAVYSEGTVNVDNSVFDKNDITFRTANDDNGGAAIYNMKGTLNIAH
ncbi:MAG: hypothetical protein Q4Q14_04245, partial [Methanobrevibacter sp.]|nr:hypothetical protein [Methanobrevibacter sp.]